MKNEASTAPLSGIPLSPYTREMAFQNSSSNRFSRKFYPKRFSGSFSLARCKFPNKALLGLAHSSNRGVSKLLVLCKTMTTYGQKLSNLFLVFPTEEFWLPFCCWNLSVGLVSRTVSSFFGFNETEEIKLSCLDKTVTKVAPETDFLHFRSQWTYIQCCSQALFIFNIVHIDLLFATDNPVQVWLDCREQLYNSANQHAQKEATSGWSN